MQFKQYNRTNISEMKPWLPVSEDYAYDRNDELGYIQAIGVSVSQTDIDNGSPTRGDMIARNPANHNDTWLVAAKYFKDNFVPKD